MDDQSATTKEPLPQDISTEQLEELMAEKKRVGATECTVILENGQQFLVCEFPPL